MKQVQLAAVEGRHYAFRGRRVQVLEDADQRRWVRLADVRAIVGFTASDGALAITYPDGVRQSRPPGRSRTSSDEALLAHLLKERSPEARAPAPLGRARDRLPGAARARAARHPLPAVDPTPATDAERRR